MHARIAKYTYTGDAQELARRAEEGMLPIFQAQPGFKAYSLVNTGEKIISFSAWDTAESAEAANAAAASWIQENMAGSIELKDATIGEILIGTAIGVSTLTGARA
jgi:heme-degrading monooxygenase HmoA